MPSATITISDKTAAAQSLKKLLFEGSQTGYTVAPAAGYSTPALGSVAHLRVQASKGNSTNLVYLGDENTANDGSRQGVELAAGDAVTYENDFAAVYLGELFPRCNANGVKLNVEWHYA